MNKLYAKYIILLGLFIIFQLWDILKIKKKIQSGKRDLVVLDVETSLKDTDTSVILTDTSSIYHRLSDIPTGCPKSLVVSFPPSGRLGNRISSYANFIVMHWTFGLEFYVPKTVKQAMESLFKHVTFPTLESLTINKCNVYFKKVDNFVKFFQEELDCRNKTIGETSTKRCNTQNVMILYEHWSPRWKFLLLAKERLFTSHLQFIDQIETKVHKIILSMGWPSSTIYIGVHVRRTDYGDYRAKSKYSLVNETYFEAAMDHYKKKFANPVFIFASDDMPWCRKHFSGSHIFHLGGNSPNVDLALLANCNHSIIDYGSYGVWGASLAGGEVVIPRSNIMNWKPTEIILLGWTMLEGF